MKYLNTLIILKHNAETYMSIIKSKNKNKNNPDQETKELKEKIQDYEDRIENHNGFILAEIINPN